MPYVSSPNSAIVRTTSNPYRHPIPYAQRQVVRATRNPKTNGETKGDMMKPMVQKFSCHNWSFANFPFPTDLLDSPFGLVDEKDINLLQHISPRPSLENEYKAASLIIQWLEVLYCGRWEPGYFFSEKLLRLTQKMLSSIALLHTTIRQAIIWSTMPSPAKTLRVGAKVQPTRRPNASTYRDLPHWCKN